MMREEQSAFSASEAHPSTAAKGRPPRAGAAANEAEFPSEAQALIGSAYTLRICNVCNEFSFEVQALHWQLKATDTLWICNAYVTHV